VSHYESGLDGIGLERSAAGDVSQDVTARAVWQSRRYGSAVTIEVQVAGPSERKQAVVTLRLVHNESARLW
jgi:hypothetical protein